jgi:hypothetical protein
MSRLMRMAYGHGGTRLERILVAAPPGGSAPAPLWLRLLLLAAWLAVPVLIGRYAVPTATQPTTIIDASRLDVKPPPLPEPAVIQEPPRVRPVEPPPQPAPSPLHTAQRPLEQPPEELAPPAITRPAAANVPDVTEYQPRIVRERARASAETGAPSAPRIRRETAAGEAPSARNSITRARSASAAEAPAAKERLAPLRRAPLAESQPQVGAAAQRPVASRDRSSWSETTEGSTPRIAATRGRAQAAGDGGSAGAPSPGLARGVSFMDLGICASDQEAEDDIKAVLSVVGSRQSCTDEKGEFRFRGTKRISSFNLMIYPGKGRRPSNRCEELENAYRCLKAR